MRRIVTIVLIAFAGFFVCAYPGETSSFFTAIITGISTGAHAFANSITTFFRTLFA